MSRPVRFLPLVLVIWILWFFAARLIRPDDPAIPSQMVSRAVPQIALQAAIPAKPGLSSKDFADGHPKLLNIFASWCVPCVGEAPVLSELKRRGVIIDAIAVRDTPQAVTEFLAAHGDAYQRIGADPQSEAQMALGSSGVPETFVVDGRGTIRRQYIGPLSAANVDGILKELEEAR